MTGFLQGVRWDSGTHGSRPTIVFFVGQGPRALPWVRRLSAGGLRAARPTEVQYEVRRGGALLPTVVPTDSRPLSWPPIGALPRNRLASSATGGASAISPPAGDREGRPYGREQEVRYGGRGRTPPLRMAGGCGGACSYGVDRVPVGGNDETSAAVMRLGSSI